MFRIFFALALIAEIAQTLYFRELLFDPVPFVASDLLVRRVLVWAWLGFAMLLTVGYGGRLVAFAVYVLNVYFLGFYFADHAIDWQVDGVFIVGSLLLVFMPADQAISIRRRRLVRRCRARGEPPPGLQLVRPVWGMALALLVASLYFHAVLWQTSSLMWLGGLGLWGPASLPYNTYYNVAPILDVAPLMLGAGYVALTFEVVFPVLIWFRRLRTPLVIVGIALHLGVAIFFPIPTFSLVMVSLYLGFVPEEIYERWYQKWERRESARPKPAAALAPKAVMRVSIAVLAIWFVLEAFVFCMSPFLPRYIAKTSTTKELAEVATVFNRAAYPYTGISAHGLLMDTHFHFYRSQFLVLYKDETRETILPMTTEQGMAGLYAWNRLWMTWTINTANPTLPKHVRKGRMKRFAAFWAGDAGVDVSRGEFVVYERPVKVSLFLWVEGLLQKNREMDWQEVGRFAIDL